MPGLTPHERLSTIQEIERILATKCRSCETRESLSQIHKKTFSKIDGHCYKQCEVGHQLRDLGRKLETGRKIKTPIWWDQGQDITADTPIITGRRGDCEKRSWTSFGRAPS